MPSWDGVPVKTLVQLLVHPRSRLKLGVPNRGVTCNRGPADSRPRRGATYSEIYRRLGQQD